MQRYLCNVTPTKQNKRAIKTLSVLPLDRLITYPFTLRVRCYRVRERLPRRIR